MESEKNEVLKAVEDALVGKGMMEEKLRATEARLQEKEMELEEMKREVQHEKLWAGELEEARRKWEEEAIRLHDRYETPEGFINTAMEKAVVTSFFKDQRCYKLFSRVATPIAGDALALLGDHLWGTDPSFERPKRFQALATTSKGNVYPWKGGPFNFEELTSAGEEEGGGDEEGGEEKAET